MGTNIRAQSNQHICACTRAKSSFTRNFPVQQGRKWVWLSTLANQTWSVPYALWTTPNWRNGDATCVCTNRVEVEAVDVVVEAPALAPALVLALLALAPALVLALAPNPVLALALARLVAAPLLVLVPALLLGERGKADQNLVLAPSLLPQREEKGQAALAASKWKECMLGWLPDWCFLFVRGVEYRKYSTPYNTTTYHPGLPPNLNLDLALNLVLSRLKKEDPLLIFKA